ncbi:hypothetical protein AAMO2058_001525600 [Amorphochlora amoebiformis]
MGLITAEGGPPADQYYACYVILFYMALATLLPWNAFISASGYFNSRLNSTAFSVNFLNFFGVAYNITNMVSLALLTYTSAGRWPARYKVLYPFLVVLLTFLVQTAMSMIPPSSLSGNSFFAISVILVTICGGANALIQAGLFGLAAKLPVMYVQGLMAGQGMGGVVPSLLVVATVALSPATEGTPTYENMRWSGFAFFGIASITALLAVFGYLLLEHIPLVHYHSALNPVESDDDALNSADLLESEMGVEESETALLAANTLAEEEKRNPTKKNKYLDSIPALRRIASTRTYIDIRYMAWGVFVNFTISLAVFPSITANIYSPEANAHKVDGEIKYNANPPEGRFYGDLFVPVYCFLLFNIFDFLGRFMAGKCPQLLPRQILFPLSLSRAVFIPLFMMCNVVEVGTSYMPVVFSHIAWPILFITLLAFSNGFLCTLEFMNAPSMVPEVLQSTAGRMMCFFTSSGLLFGCVVSFFLHYLLCSCNPILR